MGGRDCIEPLSMLLLSPHFTETKAAEYAGIMLGKSEYTVCQQCLILYSAEKYYYYDANVIVVTVLTTAKCPLWSYS